MLAGLTRWLVRAVTGLLLLIGIVVGALLLAIRTPSGQALFRERVERLIAEATGARVSIGRLGGTLVSGVVARDVLLTFPGGTRFAVAELSGSYLLTKLLGGRIELGAVTLRGLRARVVQTAGGWGFQAPGAPVSETATALPTVLIPRVRVTDGRVALDLRDAAPPRRFALTDLHLEGSLSLTESEQQIWVRALRFVPRGIDVSPVQAAGGVTLGPDGALDIEELTVATRRSQLRADARVVRDRRIGARIDASPLSGDELRAVAPGVAFGTDLSGVVVARGPWRRIGVRAALRTPAAGALRLFGRVDAGASDLGYQATLRVRHLDLAATWGTLPASDLTGRVRAQGAIATLATPLDVRLRLAPSALTGVRIDEARLTGRITSDGLDARGTVAAPAGRVSLDGRLGWAAALPTYAASATASISDLGALVPGVSGAGRLGLSLDGRGFTGRDRDATLRARLDEGRVASMPLEGAATIVARGDLVRVDAAQFLLSGVRADVRGSLDLQREIVDATLAAAGDIAGAARAGGADVAGVVTARAAVRGPLGRFAVDATATVERLRAGATALERASLAAQVEGLGGTTPTGRATADLAGLRRADQPPWTGTIAAEWQRSASTDTAAVRVDGRADDGTQLATRATIRRIPGGEIGAQLASLTLALPDHGTWELTRPASLAYVGGIVSVDRLELAAGAQRVAISGRAGPSGPADAALEWRDVELATVCRLRRTLECAGRTAGDVRLSGTAAAPRLSYSARADGVVVEGSLATAITVTGDYVDRALTLDGAITQADAGRLDVAGSLPIDLAWDGSRHDLAGRPVELTLRSDGVDLGVVRLFAPEVIRQSAGRLVVDLRLGGSWDDLRAQGTLAVRGGKLALVATGVTYDDIELLAVAAGRTLEVQTLRSRAGEGSVEGSGRLALTPDPTAPFLLQLRFDDFLGVALPAYEAATDGTLTVEGSLAYPVVRGELVLSRLLVRPALLPASGPSLEPDPTIEVVGLPTPPEGTETTPPVPSVAEALSLDLGIRIVRDAWIRRNDADVELRGDLRLGKAAYHPLFVTGEIRLVRGWYAFQGRRFDVDEGRITFGGDVPPDPQLDITALYRTRDYEITIEVTGRATAPALALSSDPPLEQADILSVVVFGRPASELGRGEGVDLQRRALSLASGYVMPELRQSVMNTLGLDTLEVGDEGFTAGRYVTRDVFVTLAQDFTGNAGQVMGVEYSLTRGLSLKMSTSTRGDSAVDLLWRRRY